MKCERCGGTMRDEQVTVSGSLVKLKNVFVWDCTQCGRVEYGTMPRVTAEVNKAVQEMTD